MMREHLFDSGFVNAAIIDQRGSCRPLDQKLIVNIQLDREHGGGATTRTRAANGVVPPAAVTYVRLPLLKPRRYVRSFAAA